MNLNAFLNPVIIQDTPRLFTAIAEWLAVFVYFNIYKRKIHGMKYIVSCISLLIVQVVYQFFAGLLPLGFWIPTMFGAVVLMYESLYIVLDIGRKDCWVVTTHAFVLAEFAASFYRQIFVWYGILNEDYSFTSSLCMVILVYPLVYGIYYYFERDNFSPDRNLNISMKELLGILATGIGAFIMSNISFINTRTPFSATDNILYVRTLVDFGGMLMLMTQMGRRNEMIARSENTSINQLFQRQYEQYKLAIDNSEAIRKEMHDMKHYILALKAEDDKTKRAEILADMEQAIIVNESFMNTGNKVLDVILTTKSLQCHKKGIILNAMVDGEVLSEMHVKDICSLFGNMLDNAIEATQQIQEEERRLIILNVRNRNKFIIVECENCIDVSAVEIKSKNVRRQYKAGSLPKTTKADNVKHGYGLKSIAQVADKYGGAMNCLFEDGWFKVKILLPAK